jgi:hypothetical protein
VAVHTISYLIEWKPVSSWVTLTTGTIIDFGTDAEMALTDNGVGFGDATTAQAQVQVLRSEVDAYAWARVPFRITPTVDSDTARAFYGVVEKASGDAETVTFQLIGITSDLGRRTKHLYSPAFYKRYVAAKTTASSIEDPTNGSYTAGLVNWIFWMAGGRPFEQAGSYPSADFYYSCGQAIAAPDWAWVAGEDGYEEARRLARAVGGQIYQADDGTVVYRSPLELVGSVAYTFADAIGGASDSLGVYGDISEEESAGQVAGTVVAQYTPRQARPTQPVIDDTTPRLIEKAGSIDVALEPKWPLKSLQTPLTTDMITATWYDGSAAPQSGSGYSYSVDVEAQQVTLSITNNQAARPMAIWHLLLNGEPIVAGEVGSVTAGSGQPTVTLEDNIYVQNAAHANLLATMALAFYGTARRVRTLRDCPYDARRTLGETVGLTSADLGLTNVPHIIISRRASAGESVEYGLVDVTGLPVAADFYLVGTTSYSTTHQLAW